jgi:hypothetical protein
MAGGVPGALCSVFVKDPTHPWDNVPQTEQDAAGLYGLLKSINPNQITHLQTVAGTFIVGGRRRRPIWGQASFGMMRSDEVFRSTGILAKPDPGGGAGQDLQKWSIS